MIVTQLVKIFIEPESLWPRSQKPITESYPKVVPVYTSTPCFFETLLTFLSKWILPFRFSRLLQYFVSTSHDPHLRYVTLVLFIAVISGMSCDEYKLWRSSLRSFLYRSVKCCLCWAVFFWHYRRIKLHLAERLQSVSRRGANSRYL